jgi:GNAT superfamily N-acetyltransferase
MKQSDDILFRAANERDARDIAEIIHDSYQRFRADHVPADMPGFHEEHIAELMDDASTRWIVASDQGQRVGVAMWRMLEGMSHLHLLYVRANHQGSGVGGRLLKRHQDEALKERPDTRLFTLHCLRDSLWAMRFYKHHGYTLYEEGDERRMMDLIVWIDACRSDHHGWPLREDKALFYKRAV